MSICIYNYNCKVHSLNIGCPFCMCYLSGWVFYYKSFRMNISYQWTQEVPNSYAIQWFWNIYRWCWILTHTHTHTHTNKKQCKVSSTVKHLGIWVLETSVLEWCFQLCYCCAGFEVVDIIALSRWHSQQKIIKIDTNSHNGSSK